MINNGMIKEKNKYKYSGDVIEGNGRRDGRLLMYAGGSTFRSDTMSNWLTHPLYWTKSTLVLLYFSPLFFLTPLDPPNLKLWCWPVLGLIVADGGYSLFGSPGQHPYSVLA